MNFALFLLICSQVLTIYFRSHHAFCCGFLQKVKSKEGGERSITALKKENEELESELSTEKLHNQQLKQELVEAENQNADLVKVLVSLVSIIIYYFPSQCVIIFSFVLERLCSLFGCPVL